MDSLSPKNNDSHVNYGEQSTKPLNKSDFQFLMGCGATATKASLGTITLHQIRDMVVNPPVVVFPFQTIDGKKVIVGKEAWARAKRKCPVFYSTDCESRSNIDVVRHNRHGALIIDIDQGNPSIGWIEAQLKKWEIKNYLIYATPSSGMHEQIVEDGEEKLRPLGKRYRVVVPYLAPCETSLHTLQTRFVTEVLGGDTSMATPNQASFLPVDAGTGHYKDSFKIVGDGPLFDPSNPPRAFATAFENYCIQNPVSNKPPPKEDRTPPVDFGPFEEVPVPDLERKVPWPVMVRKFDCSLTPFEFINSQDATVFAEFVGYRYVAPYSADTLRYDKPRPGGINVSDAGVFICQNRIRSLHTEDPINGVGDPNIKGRSNSDMLLAHVYGGDGAEHVKEFVSDTTQLMEAIGQAVKKSSDSMPDPKAWLNQHEPIHLLSELLGMEGAANDDCDAFEFLKKHAHGGCELSALGEVRAMMRNQNAGQLTLQENPFEKRVVEFKENPTAVSYLIEGFIIKGFVAFAASHGMGKTTALVTLMLCVCGAIKLDGLHVRVHRMIIYITEDCDQLWRIICETIKQHDGDLEIAKEMFRVVEAHRASAASYKHLRRLIVERWYRERPHSKTKEAVEIAPVVVLDTSNACLNIEKESDNAEIGESINKLRTLFESVIVVGHVAKGISRTEPSLVKFRGGTAWVGDAQQEIVMFEDGMEGDSKARYIYSGDECKRRENGHIRELKVETIIRSRTAEDEFGNDVEMETRVVSAFKASDELSRKERVYREKQKAESAKEIECRHVIRQALEKAVSARFDDPGNVEHYCTKSTLDELINPGKGITRELLRLVRDAMLEENIVELREFPPELRKGSRKEYIDLVNSPNDYD